MTRCGDIADYSLRMRISAIFLFLMVEVLVTDSESQSLFPIHVIIEQFNMAISGLVLEI